jgi:hypothetical protein
MTVLITLTLAGADTGPFNIYSDSDGYTTPLVTGVAKSALLAGYSLAGVPNDATIIRVASIDACNNYIDMLISNTSTTTTTTSTSTSTSTTTTTTTAIPYYIWLGPVSTFGTSGAACSGYSSTRSYYSPQNFMLSTVTKLYENPELTIPVETTGNYLPVALNGAGTIYAAVVTSGTVSFYTSCP